MVNFFTVTSGKLIECQKQEIGKLIGCQCGKQIQCQVVNFFIDIHTLELKDMIILMNRLERLSPKRISEKLNVSINTVKTIVRKSNKADRNGETPKLRVRRLTEPMNTEVLIKRLRMENQLLRDFLQLTGRK